MRYIDIKFTSYGQSYTYKTKDKTIAAGDTVVVHNQQTNSTDCVKVALVHEEYKENPRINYTWIVQKVDYTKYGKLVDKDRKAMDQERRERL